MFLVPKSSDNLFIIHTHTQDRSWLESVISQKMRIQSRFPHKSLSIMYTCRTCADLQEVDLSGYWRNRQVIGERSYGFPLACSEWLSSISCQESHGRMYSWWIELYTLKIHTASTILNAEVLFGNTTVSIRMKIVSHLNESTWSLCKDTINNGHVILNFKHCDQGSPARVLIPLFSTLWTISTMMTVNYTDNVYTTGNHAIYACSKM